MTRERALELAKGLGGMGLFTEKVADAILAAAAEESSGCAELCKGLVEDAITVGKLRALAAIAEEREACAKIADIYARGNGSDSVGLAKSETAARIAAEIRNGERRR